MKLHVRNLPLFAACLAVIALLFAGAVAAVADEIQEPAAADLSATSASVDEAEQSPADGDLAVAAQIAELFEDSLSFECIEGTPCTYDFECGANGCCRAHTGCYCH